MIAYLTFDDVNPAFFAELASKVSPKVAFRTINSPKLAVDGELVIYDLDHLPREWKAELLRQAETGRLTGEVAVHSYNLTTAEIRVLRSAGVRVLRRVSAALLVVGPVKIKDGFVKNNRCALRAVAV